ncbi:hypothetical protein OBBRIDRAFT_108754 [Obba rivulosa]|uniref:Trafficking protein particle complex II-specific subunit 65 IgD3 domain-containing protein n=1 Tax=Obba rivulosa TaxID=1052685 RepID=A0A8E2AWY6_9APHY|nr:hypothetical protein OBBRIDRAFT_108754 [Obba rivulosa]
MSAVTFADIFNEGTLEVVTPHASLGFPPSVTVDPNAGHVWLTHLRAPNADRAIAFFDEDLDFILLHRIPKSALETASDDPDQTPPPALLAYLTHLQITYDVSYISPISASSAQLQIPPRTSSLTPGPGATDNAPSQPGRAATHPSIFPPHTPNPVPGAASADRRYAQAQGTPVRVGVWGERAPDAREAKGTGKGGDKDDEDREAFVLLWDSDGLEWVAAFRMNVLVQFMSLRTMDPILSLTVSVTLRDRPLPITPPRRALAALLEATDGSQLGATSPISPNGANSADSLISGLKEVNLFEGLRRDPTFSSSPLSLPSTRLGPSTRRNAFGLLPHTSVSTSSALSPSPSTTTLRRSFRKTLRTLAGVRVRMRTVFVPYVLLPATGSRGSEGGETSNKHRKQVRGYDAPDNIVERDEDEDEAEKRAREQREAGSEEHTVVLCVEVENAFSSDPTTHSFNDSPEGSGNDSFGFMLDRAEVLVSGIDSRTVLVGWGEDLIADSTDDAKMFPLRLAPREQVNLLYAVSFLRGPEAEDNGLLVATGKSRGATDLSDTQREAEHAESCPTRSYSSRWRCILDLSPTSEPLTAYDLSFPTLDVPPGPSAMPTPATPFPMSPAPIPRGNGLLTAGQAIPPAIPTMTSRSGSSSSVPASAIAGSKRFSATALSSPVDGWRRPPVDYTGSTALLNPANAPVTSGSYTPTAASNPLLQLAVPGTRTSYFPPSMMIQQAQAGVRSPTTYAPPPNPITHPLAPFAPISPSNLRTPVNEAPPVSPGPFSGAGEAPRTPAYPAFPMTPGFGGPMIPMGLPQSVNAGVVGPTVDPRRERLGPATPGPHVGGFPVGQGYDEEAAAMLGEPIIISVGLLPNETKGKSPSMSEIYPLDKFTLDIFVFNRSSWTRRFEVSYPDERERRKSRPAKGSNVRTPGIVPLENRVRIGPLLPATCQSVRMDFLALSPGVHSLDTLVLRDVHTGYSMNLRCVAFLPLTV